jgi:hypothetical protein
MSEPASTADHPMLPGDETAALQWAIENFRNNARNLKDPDSAKKRWAYNKQLLMNDKSVETIQRGNTLSIVVPESYEELHRMDHDELVDLIAAAREERETHEYLLAVAAALIDNGYSLPGPLKEFVIEFLPNPEVPRRGRGRKREYMRDDVIAWVVSSICIQWGFSPTRNEATRGPSAISIVKRALEKVGIHLTEAAITKIWDKSGPHKELVTRVARRKKTWMID